MVHGINSQYFIITTLGWLTPLLSRVKENQTAVICPVIEMIYSDTLGTVTGKKPAYALGVGGFDWSFVFRWYQQEVTRYQLLPSSESHGRPVR